MAQKLRQSFPSATPAPALTKIWNEYSMIFSHQPLQPVTLNLKYPLSFDYKETLIEIPQEKQGGYQNQKQSNPNWRGANANRQQGVVKIQQRVFQQSGLCDDPLKKAWFYQDEQKQNHGPFTSKEMDSFLTKNAVDANTRVALESLDKFVRIEKIIKIAALAQQKLASQPPQPLRFKDPFQISKLTTSLDSKVWYYKQTTESVGPLSTLEIDALWSSGELSETARIAFESTDKFIKMEKILKLAEGNQEEALKNQELEKKRIQEEQNKKQQETQKLEEIERLKKEQKEAALRWLDEEEDKRQKIEEDKRIKLVNKFGVQNMWAPDAKSPIVTGTVTQGNVAKKVGKNDKKTTKTETTTVVPEIIQVQPKQAEKKVEKVVPRIVQVVDDREDDDEWQSVSGNATTKKKSNTIPNAANIPGLSTKATVKPVPVQQVKKVVQVVQQVQQQVEEDDEWNEVPIIVKAKPQKKK